jgi:hypothetical protein
MKAFNLTIIDSYLSIFAKIIAMLILGHIRFQLSNPHHTHL